ncbi:hypothetical protein V2H45_17510 [Tumidithrix elongata RA019]|uniref:Uncharacterized protein n=1 Tax=Tumidithrix elongata BACA0141 TaxID=2716417 RepID=A0AAW9Q523_9CYAN|nr:hypothetical protein [Tumidithrix elongata RA019]
MVKIQNQLTVYQDYISQLLEQLSINYQNTKLERQLIFKKDFSNYDEDFMPLEELELLTVNIRGYACQIEDKGTVNNYKQAIAELKTLSVFNNHTIVQLYNEARSHYPQIQSYISMLDYLRLLVLEYLQIQQNFQPISA